MDTPNEIRPGQQRNSDKEVPLTPSWCDNLAPLQDRMMRRVAAGHALTSVLQDTMEGVCSCMDLEFIEVRLTLPARVPVQVRSGLPLHRLFRQKESANTALLLNCLCGCFTGQNKQCFEPLKNRYTPKGSCWWANAEILGQMVKQAGAPDCMREFQRLYCGHTGALIPLRDHETHIGMLLVLDTRENAIRADAIDRLEQLSSIILVVVQYALMKEHLHLLTEAVEQSTESTIITDYKGDIIYVNPAFEKISGYTAAEVLGRNPRILNSGQQTPDYYANMWASLQEGNPWRGRFINRAKNGDTYTEQALIFPVRDHEGHTTHYVANKRDVSREVTLENQLRQSQKMDAVGRLAGGIAHDFNNLLTSILGFSKMALDALPADHMAYEDLQEVIHSGERASQLTNQLMTLSRKQQLEEGPVHLNDVIRGMDKLLRNSIAENIALQLDFKEHLASITADTSGLEQIILNLAINARDAMEGGGTLTIQTDSIHVQDPLLLSLSEIPTGHYVVLRVCDTGVGISAEQREKIFEPFFTTKPKGKGTGLGLAMVYSIVQQFRGYIDCVTALGRGTAFHLYFPASSSAEKPRKPSSVNQKAMVGGAECILLVEDDNSLRQLGLRLLPKLGYNVLSAANGQEALDVLQKHAEEVDLLFTDMVMPTMGGYELAQRVAKTYPSIKIVFTTGFSQDAIAQDGTTSKYGPLLPKPYTQTSLATLIREVLDKKVAG